MTIFIGDVVFTEDVQVVVSMTTDAPATYDVTIDYGAGTWFASILHLWQHAVYVWNLSIPGGEMSATLVTDTLDANFGKIKVNPDSGLGTITDLDFTFPSSVYADCGLTAATWNSGAGNTARYTTNAISPLFVPYWPLKSMHRSVENLTGYTGRAASGASYSVAGAHQEKITLSANIDRKDYVEVNAWLDLFSDRLSRGLSVLFYLDVDNTPTEWAETLDEGVNLTLSSNQSALDFTRIVEYTNVQDFTQEVEFGVRPYNTLETAEFL